MMASETPPPTLHDEMKKRAKVGFPKPRVGQVFSVPLSDGALGFGQCIGEFMWVFFDLFADRDVLVDEVVRSPLIGHASVADDGVRKGAWSLIGIKPVVRGAYDVSFWAISNQDLVEGGYSISEWRTGAPTFRIGSYDEVRGLEPNEMLQARDVEAALSAVRVGAAWSDAIWLPEAKRHFERLRARRGDGAG